MAGWWCVGGVVAVLVGWVVLWSICAIAARGDDVEERELRARRS